MAETLVLLQDKDFQQELYEAIHDNEWFAEFLHPEVVDKARLFLVQAKMSISRQLADYKEENEWRSRAVNKMRCIERRLTEIKARRAELANESRKNQNEWADFAFELAQLVASSSLEPMLDEVFIGTMSARQYLMVRNARADLEL
jgi:hypothetical protein